MTRRDMGILRAVADGRCQMTLSVEPVLLVDGIFCSDQFTVHQLVQHGLIRPAGTGCVGQVVGAEITDAGRRELEVPL